MLVREHLLFGSPRETGVVSAQQNWASHSRARHMGESWAPVLARGCPPRAECCHRTVSPDLKGQAQAAVPGLDAFPTHSPAGSGSTPDRASDQTEGDLPAATGLTLCCHRGLQPEPFIILIRNPNPSSLLKPHCSRLVLPPRLSAKHTFLISGLSSQYHTTSNHQ